MGLLDFLKPKENNNSSEQPPIRKKLDQIVANVEALQKQYKVDNNVPFHQPRLAESGVTLEPSDISDKNDLLYLSSLLPSLNKENNKTNRNRIEVITQLFYNYSFSKVDFSDEELYQFIANWKIIDRNSYLHWSKGKLFSMVTRRIDEKGMNDTLKQTLLLFVTEEKEYMYNDDKKRNEAIQYRLQEDTVLPVNEHDEWGKMVIIFINGITNPDEKKNWIELLKHCYEAGDKSTPPKNWLQKTTAILNNIGHEQFSFRITEWLSFVSGLIQAIHKNERRDFLRDVNHNLLKNIIWCVGIINDNALTAALDNYAAIAYKKKPGTGPISLKTGNASMYAFSLLPFKEAVTRLMKFRNKTTNNTIIKSIDKVIGELAKKNGYDKNLVAEIGVMDFGLDDNASKKYVFDTVTCELKIVNGEVEVNWSKDGKNLKAVPTIVKTDYASSLKEIKNEVKELTAQLAVQKDRIESYYLKKKKWNYSDWKENYLQHPLVQVIAGRIIWVFKNKEYVQTGFYFNGELVNSDDKAIDSISEETEVELWHPIFSSIDEIVAWRNFIQKKEITQPFKQAYREIYLLTDAEITTDAYSNRFAAHVLRQHQFTALCKQRGWSYHLMGNWDSHNTPTVHIPEWNMMAQYYVDADWQGVANEVGIFSYIATDQVRFYEKGELCHLIHVPKLVFSEIMRDVDLFVGVASIGNDPGWSDTGHEAYSTYWREYSFGDLSESAKIRSEVLQQLIPRLKIRNQCSFEGKYLIVKGKLRTYKIHMGSGNILMEPNDQYLCIVPDSRSRTEAPKLFLPFEGDNLLSIIVSKALLLAEDDKIKDETITRQLKISEH
jgi:hypothetical protein